MQYEKQRRKKPCTVRLLAAAVFIALSAVIWVETSVAGVLFSYGEHAVTTKTQAMFADTVGTLCADADFSAAVTVQTDENGDVQALSTNAALQNKLQSELAAALCEAFEKSDRASFSVPLWSLLGDPLSSGRGPSVRFSVAMAGSPVVTLADEFVDAGINQTYHTVTAKAEITVLITALGKQKQTVLSLSVPVSQTVVAGDVPLVYAAF